MTNAEARKPVRNDSRKNKKETPQQLHGKRQLLSEWAPAVDVEHRDCGAQKYK
jgi:hypothetical protein